MILYIAGKLAPSSTHFTRGLVKYVPGRGYCRVVPSHNGINLRYPPPPQSSNDSSLDGFGRLVPRCVLNLHTFTLNMVLTSCFRRQHPRITPSTSTGLILSHLSHAISYRWRLLPSVHQHWASGPHSSSTNECYLSGAITETI